MAYLPIEKGKENEILRTVSKEVKRFDANLKKFFLDMRETMFKADGIGIAAPQVSENIRAVVCRFNHETKNELIVDMVNPEIIETSAETDIHDEGCLSLPKQFGPVERYKTLTVKFFDKKGQENILKLSGLNARIVQHEVDHINGFLFIDRVHRSHKVSHGKD